MKMKKLLTFMVVCTIALQSYAQAARNNLGIKFAYGYRYL